MLVEFGNIASIDNSSRNVRNIYGKLFCSISRKSKRLLHFGNLFLNATATCFERRHPESNRGIKVLQTSALPLGYVAAC